MTETDPIPGPKPPGSLVRDTAVIVLVGVALGLAHNAFMLGSGPRAGLSWIKERYRHAKLEDVRPETPVAPSTASASHGVAAEPHARASVTAPATKPPAAATAPAPAAEAPATTAAPPADVPDIPVTREPLEAGLAVIRKLHAANAAVFVDARALDEYAEGHIPGAVHLSFDDVFRNPELAKQFDDRGLPVVAYCGGGDCDLSRNLAFSLIDGGKKRVLVFLEGTAGWAAAGLPMAKSGQP